MKDLDIKRYAVAGLLIEIKDEQERLKKIKDKAKQEQIKKHIEELSIKYDALRVICSPIELKDSVLTNRNTNKYW